MPIESLPATTIRLIGSTQVLTDPSCAVKELIDNALDAKATAIVVEIAANTLDTIQVRDNGHGVMPSDRVSLCRPHTTSKIRDFTDIRRVGGKWLGFRGEALACLADLSGPLTIITRVEGEAVAARLTFDRKGQISAYVFPALHCMASGSIGQPEAN
jgi:DNA mismatch repair ATPase MutL